jgi:hypothetical protein
MATYRTGGEVDAFCTRCKFDLAHTILAMVGSSIARVRCNTCGGDHVYRGQKAVKEPSKAPATRAPGTTSSRKAEREVISFDQLLASRDVARSVPYSTRETFKLDQVVTHPTFGQGFVSAVRGDKVDITFRSEVKTLIHGRGGAAPAEKPTYHAPTVGGAAGSSDKPPSNQEPGSPGQE